MLLRAFAIAATLALAACAAPASQTGAQDASSEAQDRASSEAQVASPASPATQPATHRLRTGGPNPPQRIAAHCAVDADCAAKPQCIDEDCRCVRDTCIVNSEALDPSIDPAPATTVR
jgi:hypothetical protein